MEAGGQRPLMRLRDFYINQIYSSQVEGTSFKELQVQTELKCRAADSVPTETEPGGTRLVLSSADYNLIWGVLTQKRSQRSHGIKHR